MVKLPLPFLLTLLLAPLAAPPPVAAQGQLHKCVDAKGKVSYQDFPCDQAPHISIQEAPRAGAANPPADGASSPVMRQLDASVKAAIATNDLSRAKGLAVTGQHWEWIAEAEKSRQTQAVTGRTRADLRAEKGTSQECRDARRSYELESRSPEATEKMKQLMYEACGMEAPADTGAGTVQTIIVGRPHPLAHPPRPGYGRPGIMPPDSREPSPQRRPLMRRSDQFDK